MNPGGRAKQHNRKNTEYMSKNIHSGIWFFFFLFVKIYKVSLIELLTLGLAKNTGNYSWFKMILIFAMIGKHS